MSFVACVHGNDECPSFSKALSLRVIADTKPTKSQMNFYSHPGVVLAEAYKCSSGCEDYSTRKPCLVGDVSLENHQALIRELGLPLTCTDEKMILSSAIARWGWGSFINHIRGEFAFVAVDPATRKVYAFRDRLGIKILYYTRCGTNLLVCPQFPPLIRAHETPFSIDREYFARHLRAGVQPFGAVDSPDTRVKIVQPGHSIEIHGGRVCASRYWRPENLRKLRLAKRDEYVDRFRDAFFRSVGDRLPASGITWFDVSGGLDSTAVLRVANALSAKRGNKCSFHGRSIINRKHPEFSEDAFIAAAAEGMPVTIHYEALENAPLIPVDFSKDWMLWDAPTHSYLTQPETYRFSRLAARSGGSAYFSGHGADHVLTHPSFSYLFSLFLGCRWSRLRRDLKEIAGLGVPLFTFSLQRVVKPWIHAKAAAPSTDAPWLTNGCRNLLRENNSNQWSLFDHPPDQEHFDYILSGAVHCHNIHASGLYLGLQRKLPYMDSRFIELMLQVPVEHRIRPSMTKSLFREAMVDVVPDSIRLKQQQPTGSSRFLDSLKLSSDMARRLIESSILCDIGLANRRALQQALRHLLQGDGHFLGSFSSFLSAELWLNVLRTNN